MTMESIWICSSIKVQLLSKSGLFLIKKKKEKAIVHKSHREGELAGV